MATAGGRCWGAEHFVYIGLEVCQIGRLAYEQAGSTPERLRRKPGGPAVARTSSPAQVLVSSESLGGPAVARTRKPRSCHILKPPGVSRSPGVNAILTGPLLRSKCSNRRLQVFHWDQVMTHFVPTDDPQGLPRRSKLSGGTCRKAS